MSRMVDATTARLRLALAVLVSGSAALVLPPSLAATTGAPSGLVLATVALAAVAALLAYWACNSLWTLVQSAVIWRWFPTPGSPAAGRQT